MTWHTTTRTSLTSPTEMETEKSIVRFVFFSVLLYIRRVESIPSLFAPTASSGLRMGKYVRYDVLYLFPELFVTSCYLICNFTVWYVMCNTQHASLSDVHYICVSFKLQTMNLSEFLTVDESVDLQMN